MIIILTLAGFLSSFVDSLLNAFFEPKLLSSKYFQQEQNKKTELPVPNDIINLIGSSSAIPVFMMLSIVV